MALRQKVRALAEGIARMIQLPVNPSVRGTAKQANRLERGPEGMGGRPEGRGTPGGGGRGGKRTRRRKAHR